MKKVLVSIALMAVAFSTHVFANSNYDVFYKLNDKSTFKSMVRYLQTDDSQTNDLQYIFHLTEKKLKAAKGNAPELEKTLRFNLANVKAALSPEQYRKYLIVLNLSIQNQEFTYFAEK
ncbi:MAG: hypothetical protein LBS07_02140 [Prevotellaceae bacterium]|jgi:hypothetical protein|nr:hypothetical protein [Prevotellaceae bacterium]